MQLELKLDSIEEFLTLMEALRPTPMSAVLDHTLDEAIGDEAMDEIADLVKVNDQLRDEMAAIRREQEIQRGSLEQTIEELHDHKRAEGKAEAPGQKLALRGVYCRYCGKMLNGTTQRIFCSQACAGRWTGQHRGEKATPRMTLKDEMLGTTVVAGVGVRDN